MISREQIRKQWLEANIYFRCLKAVFASSGQTLPESPAEYYSPQSLAAILGEAQSLSTAARPARPSAVYQRILAWIKAGVPHETLSGIVLHRLEAVQFGGTFVFTRTQIVRFLMAAGMIHEDDLALIAEDG